MYGTAEPVLVPASLLSQFAFGGGWYSAIYLTNHSPVAVSFPVRFTSDNGVPLVLPSIPTGTQAVSIPAGGTTIIEAPNTGSLVQGYASMNLPTGVTGYGVFRQSVQGRDDQEAVVPLANSSTKKASITFDETVFTTAVAIVNPAATTTTVTVVAHDTAGVTIGTSSLTLPPNGKGTFAVRSIPGLSGVVGKRGFIEFSVDSAGVGLLGLRFGGSAFTSIPATEE